MANEIVHWEVVWKDGKAAGEFYSKLFGWEIDTNNPQEYGVVAAPEGGGVGGGVGGTVEGEPGHLTFYVGVDDLQECLDKVESLGGKTIMPPTEVPDMVTFALFTDPEGHMMGLVKNE